MRANDLIQKLHLLRHPEGGYYAETYRSLQTITLQEGISRPVSTAIYYLLEEDDKSHFHRIQSDEMWFFHQGESLEIMTIHDGVEGSVLLGNDVEKGEVPQACIHAHTWFAAKIRKGKGYALVSCTVAPGFDFRDFELAKRDMLLRAYPKLKDIIEEFTRP